MAIVIDEVTSADALDALAPEWETLWRGARTATPFQSPAWLLPWWRHFGQGAPLVLALRDGAALVGVAPLYTFRAHPGDPGRLVLIGTGNTDHLDVLLADDLAAEGAAAVVEYLAARCDDGEECDLQQLDAASPLVDAAARCAAHAAVDDGAPCPALDLPASVDELPERLPNGFGRRVAYQRRRAARSGAVRIDAAMDAAAVTELLDALFALHAQRWGLRGERGVLADVRVQAFHREAAAGLLACGALRCYGLRVDDRLIGVYYGFGDGRSAYYYIGGFDPAYAALSPGTLVVAHAVEEAVREGARAFDFLRGREPYKYAWGATDRPSRHLVLRGSRARACVRG